jgi:preprotein translocase subunit SecA
MINLISKAVTSIFGTKSDKDLRLLSPVVEQVNAEFSKLAGISDDELRQQTQIFKDEIADYLADIQAEIIKLDEQVKSPDIDLEQKDEMFKELDKLKENKNAALEDVLMELLPRAFAVVKETARRLKDNKRLVVEASDFDHQISTERTNVEIADGKATWSNKWIAAGSEITWDMLHYDVQLIGGMVLHQGKIAEMATGEGKTLVSTLPSYLNALAGNGVHIVTVNNYLAIRDSEWMGPLLEFHKMRVDCIDKHQPHSQQRRAAYQADVTYGTNNEFGFDYLRDNMVRSPEEQVQRLHHYAMVDEVDSVLIDDARTPLIISGPVPKGRDQEEFINLKPRIDKISAAQRKLVMQFITEAKKALAEGDKEAAGLALLRANRGLPKYKPLIKLLSEPGNKPMMQKVENYYLQDNSKMMPEADKPLLFTIDEKNNNIELTEKGLEMITKEGEDEDFFVMPDIGSVLADIEKDRALSDEEKIAKKDEAALDYSNKAQRIHVINQLLKAYALFENNVDYIIQEGKIKIVDEQTGRIMEGRRYSDGLHQALEAKENVKIEDATQTYATVTLQNYFRMYHKLAGMTGTAETEAGEFWEIYKLDVVVIPTNRPIQRDDRNDKVYRTVREKFNAVVDEVQNIVEAKRPVLVGTTSVETSELLSRFLKMRGIEHQVLNAKQHAKEADVVAKAGIPGTVTIATNMAGRGTDIKLSKVAKDAGGLAIIGTERHESRRVDRQLRGRAGRQGDPGSSQFFVSLEDNLMRLFGSDRIAKNMQRLGMQEGEVIQNSLVTRAIENAQKKVEENNFSIRKRLLEYDNVMNFQRKVIYTRRNNALFGGRLQYDIQNMFWDVAENLANVYKGDEYENFRLQALQVYGRAIGVTEEQFHQLNILQLTEALYEDTYQAYIKKNEAIRGRACPIIEKVYKERGAQVKDIVVPFTDGQKQLNVVTELKAAHESNCRALIGKLQQNIVLAVIDATWKEHLREMDELKQQVQYAVHEQKDPLVIYKKESFDLFQNFIGEVNEEIIGFLAASDLPQREAPEVQAARPGAIAPPRQPKMQESKVEASPMRAAGSAAGSSVAEAPEPPKPKVTAPISSQKMYGRNDRVKVKYADGTLRENIKFKQIEEDLKENRCYIVE